MLKPDSVFIIGAGVSMELGLPLGSGLKTQIADCLPGVAPPAFSVEQALRRVDGAYAAAEVIKGALPITTSIDNLVEHHRNNKALVRVAKIGIAAAIAKAERGSRLFAKPGQTIDLGVHDTVFGDLCRMIVAGCDVDQLEASLQRVAFVNFNYDRCLEQYMYLALQQHSNLAPERAAQLVSGLRVWHPYGWIGVLPWMNDARAPSAARVQFGPDLERMDVSQVAEGIMTFSESRASTVDDEIKQAISSARRLVFLGCALHPQNMALIAPPASDVKEIFGTCYVVPPEDKYATPNIEEFSIPLIQSFAESIEEWAVDPYFRFEVLNSRQLLQKYQALMRDR